MPFDRKPEPTPVRRGEDVFAEEYRRALDEARYTQIRQAGDKYKDWKWLGVVTK